MSSTTTTPVLKLAPCFTERGETAAASLMEEADRPLFEASEELLRAAGVAGGAAAPAEASGRDTYQRVQTCIWSALRAWGRLRAEGDAGLKPADIGHWLLAAEEELRVNVGLVDVRLFIDASDKEAAREQLLAIFRERSEPRFPVLLLADVLLDEYRKALRIAERLRDDEEARQSMGVAREQAVALEALWRAQRELLDAHDEARPLLPVQQQLAELYPHLARLSRARQGGVGAELRVEMKVRETAQRLQLRIQEALPVYNQRKEYEQRQRDILRSLVEIQDLEERALGGANSAGLGRDQLSEAFDRAFQVTKRRAARAARVPLSMDAPYLLEHTPRITPKFVDERWRELHDACPRFARMHEQAAFGAPRVLLLPGNGSAMIDRESGDLLACLFPTEVRLDAFIALLAEAHLLRDDVLKESWSTVCGINPKEDAPELRETFRKELSDWLRKSVKSRQAGTTTMDKWFQRNLVEGRPGTR